MARAMLRHLLKEVLAACTPHTTGHLLPWQLTCSPAMSETKPLVLAWEWRHLFSVARAGLKLSWPHTTRTFFRMYGLPEERCHGDHGIYTNSFYNTAVYTKFKVADFDI